jgi:hypothetical protein
MNQGNGFIPNQASDMTPNPFFYSGGPMPNHSPPIQLLTADSTRSDISSAFPPFQLCKYQMDHKVEEDGEIAVVSSCMLMFVFLRLIPQRTPRSMSPPFTAMTGNRKYAFWQLASRTLSHIIQGNDLYRLLPLSWFGRKWSAVGVLHCRSRIWANVRWLFPQISNIESQGIPVWISRF